MTMEVTCSGLTSELLGGRDRSGVHTRLGLCPLLPPRLSPEGRVREGTPLSAPLPAVEEEPLVLAWLARLGGESLALHQTRN